MEPNEKCHICSESFPVSDFGRHLRRHKIRVQEYYETYYPKTDLYTEDRMEFRDRESYFLHDFSSRANLIGYLTNAPTREKDLYAQSLLERHRVKRDWKYQPSQVELRASVLPARNYYERFGLFSEICEQAGLLKRFEDKPEIVIPDVPADFEIWYDTREQQPLSFKHDSRKVKLDFGDYVGTREAFSGLFIERKSLPDFVGTLSQGFERFEAEIKRAKNLDCYLVVCVEVNIQDAMRFRLPQSKASPVFIFHRLKLLMQKFDNLQFVFANGREEMAELVTNIILLGEQAKHIDLQYHLERNQLWHGKNTRAL